MLLRFGLGGLLIFLFAATATATAGLLGLKELTDKLNRIPGGHIGGSAITKAEAGKPQTLLMLGSDRRWADLKKNNPSLTRSNPARSDTIMLVRLDPDQDATAVMSIPRDLKVDIPGHGTDKINAAYSVGGPDLTLRTVKALLGIEINHVINVNFLGFRRAVDTVDCVYMDVDRRYYHSNLGLPAGAHYAEIDIRPGYQRLCGQDALDYVRFRHTDNDLVRGARQQDFLRAAKDQVSTSSLIGKRGELVDIFAKATQTDRDLGTIVGLERLLKLGLFSAGHPISEIRFPGEFAGDEQAQFVVASPEAIARAVRRFLHASPSSKPRGGDRAGRAAGGRARRGGRGAGVVDAGRAGRDHVARMVAEQRVPFPVYYPELATPQGRYTGVQPSPRAYTLRDRADRRRHAYRLVLVQSEIDGQYYGVQGTDWRTPPLLARPTSKRDVRGRRLLLYRDGDRLRVVAWRTKRAVYWVSNTLSLSLTNTQMLAIARSLKRFPQPAS
jgi:LCP family protein required for cell wall assembly